MVKAFYDSTRNVLIIEFSGTIDASQMKQFFKELPNLFPKHKTGFKVLTDLSRVDEVKPEIKEPVKRLMDFLDEQDVSEIIRVIADPLQDIGLNIMSPFHYSKDVQFATVQTREEAEARL